MLNKIQKHKVLSELITCHCCENDIEVLLSSTLEKASDSRVLILKPDLYYNSIKMHNPPPALDCIIIIKCTKSNTYSINLIELRDINSSKGFNNENIVQKFKTVVYEFLQSTFSDIFLEETYCQFNCYFVSNPYKKKGLTQNEYDDLIKAKSLKLDYFNSMKPLKFKDKIAIIKSVLPVPIIEDC